MSKKMYPVIFGEVGGFRLQVIDDGLIVAPKLPLRAAALPASTGIEILSIMRMLFAPLWRDGLYT
jgi:hypothetical protein